MVWRPIDKDPAEVAPGDKQMVEFKTKPHDGYQGNFEGTRSPDGMWTLLRPCDGRSHYWVRDFEVVCVAEVNL
ncbi:hypothetical protein BKG82_27165 [Mycobacteroides chelonae]|uniref:Uncharacterized protein n=1 Tax=Mycobacteroides chelonae TaxID=1774 RepID=A0A1S1LGQ6_MYCCH|nr:hypothetical protein [Mycobacteroides chelonae]OHU47335.1 hypothetical protein BKG82_27165 [Mycobacteroides chelonae]